MVSSTWHSYRILRFPFNALARLFSFSTKTWVLQGRKKSMEKDSRNFYLFIFKKKKLCVSIHYFLFISMLLCWWLDDFLADMLGPLLNAPRVNLKWAGFSLLQRRSWSLDHFGAFGVPRFLIIQAEVKPWKCILSTPHKF